MTTLDTAKEFHKLGWPVIPVAAGQKGPKVSWGIWRRKQQKIADLKQLFGDLDSCNFWIVCGQISGIVVIDADNAEAEEWLYAQIPDLETTWRVKTAKGHHFYFKWVGEVSNRSLRAEGMEIDIRGDGGGVIVPPSVHESGVVYEWEVSPWDHGEGLLDFPFTGGVSMAPPPSRGQGKQRKAARTGRESLASLLQQAGTMGDGDGRNELLAKVCGHLARTHQKSWDDYIEEVDKANQHFVDPLPGDEVERTAKSIWKADRNKVRPDDPNVHWELQAENGQLNAVSTTGLLDAWGDFDIEATAVARDEEHGETWYRVRLHTGSGVIEDVLSSNTLASVPALTKWLMGRGAHIHWVKHVVAPGTLLAQYMRKQNPAQRRVLDWHGWHDDIGYVYNGIVINKDEITPSEHIVRTHPSWAKFGYGEESEENEARRVLREVMTFQDPTAAAVFGSWWAATFLKGQMEQHTSLFPFLALEASSESGKTRGFFALMMELSGMQEGPGQFTTAVLRNKLSAHRNGIVWIDDKTWVDSDLDMIRLATGEETMSKTAEDRTSRGSFKLVAPVVISGESLGPIVTSKAYMDRAILLNVPSPINRKSRKDPTRFQWDDIQDLHTRYHRDLSQLAGSIVKMALQQSHLIDKLPLARRGRGRAADKWGTLLLGAMVLTKMVDDVNHSIFNRVKKWIDTQYDAVQVEDALTFMVVPRIWRKAGYPRKGWRATTGPQPVWYDEENECGWIHQPSLFSEWLEYAKRNGIYDPRTQDQSALARQRVRAGITHSHRMGPDRNHKAVFWMIPPELWARIRDRAEM